MAKIDIEIGVKNKVSSGLAGIKSGIQKFASGAVSAIKGISVAVVSFATSLWGIKKAFTDAASNAEEVRTKFEAVFSSMTVAAGDTAQNLAKDFRLAGSTAQELLANTGDLLVGFGFAEDAALDLSDKVARLGIDLASFTNYSKGSTGATEALTKLLLGETEQAKALGIVVRQGSKEYQDAVKQKMEDQKVSLLQAKALVSLEMAMRQSQKAMGDFERTQNGVANLQRTLTERIKEFREKVGAAIIGSTGYENILKKVSQAISRLTGIVTDFIDSGRIDIWAENAAMAFEWLMPFISKIGQGIAKVTGAIQTASAYVGAIAGGAGSHDEAMSVVRDVKETSKLRMDAIRKEAEARRALRDQERQALREQQQVQQNDNRIAIEGIERERDIALEAQEEKIKALEKEKARKEEIVRLGINGLLEEAKKKRELEKQEASEMKKAERLRNNLRISGSLSKKDQEWLDAFDLLDKAKKKEPSKVVNLDQMIKDAQKELIQIQDRFQQKILDVKPVDIKIEKMTAEQKQTNKLLTENLQLG